MHIAGPGFHPGYVSLVGCAARTSFEALHGATWGSGAHGAPYTQTKKSPQCERA